MAAPLGLWLAVQAYPTRSGGLFVCWAGWTVLCGTATAIASLAMLSTPRGEIMPDQWGFFSIMVLEVAVAASIAVAAFGPGRLQPWTEGRAASAEVVWIIATALV